MLHKIFLLYLILIGFTQLALAAPAATTNDGMDFVVTGASINRASTGKYLAVDFRFNNKTLTRKLDLDGGFQYALSDNFNNRYRPLTKPSGYTQQAEELPPNFPSVYPGESCTTTLFFEAPVAHATTFELLVTAPGIGIMIPVPVQFQITSAAAVQTAMAAPHIDIRSPENGTVIEKNTELPLDIVIAGPLPERIIIAAFGQTLQDRSPAQNNTYNITIPANIQSGPTSISVIGHWRGKTPPEDRIASKEILLHINEPPASSQL